MYTVDPDQGHKIWAVGTLYGTTYATRVTGGNNVNGFLSVPASNYHIDGPKNTASFKAIFGIKYSSRFNCLWVLDFPGAIRRVNLVPGSQYGDVSYVCGRYTTDYTSRFSGVCDKTGSSGSTAMSYFNPTSAVEESSDGKYLYVSAYKSHIYRVLLDSNGNGVSATSFIGFCTSWSCTPTGSLSDYGSNLITGQANYVCTSNDNPSSCTYQQGNARINGISAMAKSGFFLYIYDSNNILRVNINEMSTSYGNIVSIASGLEYTSFDTHMTINPLQDTLWIGSSGKKNLLQINIATGVKVTYTLPNSDTGMRTQTRALEPIVYNANAMNIAGLEFTEDALYYVYYISSDDLVTTITKVPIIGCKACPVNSVPPNKLAVWEPLCTAKGGFMTIVDSALTGFNGIDFNFNPGGGAYCCATAGCATTTIKYDKRCSRFDVSLPCFYEEFFQTITLGDCVCSGQWLSDGTCTPPPCAAGQYMESGTCTSCPVDTYQDNANFMGTACTACPAGSSTLGATGSTTSTACKCNAGYYGPDGGTCSACGVDTYKATTGSAACTACSANSGTNGVIGATSAGNCVCVPGHAFVMAESPYKGPVSGNLVDAVNGFGCVCGICSDWPTPYSTVNGPAVVQDGHYHFPRNSMYSWRTQGSYSINHNSLAWGMRFRIHVDNDWPMFFGLYQHTTEVMYTYCQPTTTNPYYCTVYAGNYGFTFYFNLEEWVQLFMHIYSNRMHAKFVRADGMTSYFSGPLNANYGGSYHEMRLGGGNWHFDISHFSWDYTVSAGTTWLDAAGFPTVCGSCQACASGKYNANANGTCQDCPTSSSTDGLTGSTSITACKCNAGYSGPDGGACAICGADYYKAATGAAPCSACPSHSSTATVQGSTAVSACKCDAGYAGDLAVDASCSACAAGFAKPGAGPGACYECAGRDAHSVAINPTASVACVCAEGYFWDSLVCAACPTAYFKDSTGNVSTCHALDPSEECCQCSVYKTTAASASDAAEDCLCIAGYEGGTGTDECVECAVGKYKSGLGSTACEACAMGGTTTGVASTQASACVSNVGYVAANGGFEACSYNTYQPVVGGTSCVACPTGAISSLGSTAETDCVCNTALGYVKSNPSASVISYCVCAAGYYMSQPPSPLTWDFSTLQATVSAWTTYTASIGGSSKVDGCYPAGCYSAGGSVGWIEVPLPGGYDKVEVTFNKIYGGLLFIHLESVLVYSQSWLGQNTYTITGYTAGQKLRVSEDTGLITGLIIRLSSPPAGCYQCSAGKYCPGSDTGYPGSDGVTYTGEQTACPAHSHTLAAGSTSIADCVCDAGYTAEAETGNCVPCGAGYLKATAGNGGCSACPEHSSSPVASTSLSSCLCDPGYTGPDGGPCQACGGGTFKAGGGSAGCTACPANSDSPPSSDDVSDCVCAAGFEGPGGGPCAMCSADTYKSTGDAACLPCAASSSSPNGSTAAAACLCNAGYTGPDGGPCSACAAGTFKAGAGSAPCSACHAHSSSPAGATMQHALPPEPVPGVECTTNTVTLQGTCGMVTTPGTWTASLILQGLYPGVVARLGSVRNTSKIRVRMSSLGRWQLLTGVPVEQSGDDPVVLCKQFDILSSEIHEFDTSDCRATDEVYLQYVQHSESVIMDLHYFVVYGAPPASCTCDPGHFKHDAECLACAANQYKERQGDSGCGNCSALAVSPAASTSIAQCQCPPGHTGDAANSEPCQGCPANEYKDAPGSLPCVVCDPDSSSPPLSDSETDCTCNAGFRGPPGGPCVECGAGQYAGAGSTECVSCGFAQTAPPGSDALLDCVCNQGYSGPDGGPCEACPAGKYKNALGSEACVSCPANSDSPLGSDSPTDCACNAGYTGESGSNCTACAADTYKVDSGAAGCLPCPEHSSSPAASTQSGACVCAPGYSGGHGSECTLCAAGTYEDTAQHSCWPCSAHSTSPEGSDAQTDCTCNAGYSGPDGGTCAACPVNTFKNSSGSAACTACTEFSTSPAGSDSAADCACDPGYLKTGDGSCGRVCAAGFQMSADGTACDPCPNSYYKTEGGEHTCARCPAHAMHGLTGQTTVDVCYCEQGYIWDSTMKTCNICANGTFNNRANESRCFQCVANNDVTAVPADPWISADLFRIRCVCTNQLLHQDNFVLGSDTRLNELVQGDGYFGFHSIIGVYPEPFDWNNRYNFAKITWNEPAFDNGLYLDDLTPSKFVMIGIRFKLYRKGNHVQVSKIQSILAYMAYQTVGFRIQVRNNNNPATLDFDSYGNFAVNVNYEKWISIFAQAYNTRVYVKMQVEDSPPIFFDIAANMNAGGEMRLLLGTNFPSQKYYSAHMDVSHLFIDNACSNTNLLNTISFQTDCLPPVSDHTKCPGLTQVPAGYQATASGANLEPCPANSYNDGTLLKCAQCPSPGTFSSLGGLTSVSQCGCQPGYTRVGGVCTACAVGSYKSVPGDAACSACWAHATTLQTASTSHESCKCVPNYGANPACNICRGHYGPGGSGAAMLEPDRWWTCTNGCNCRDLADESSCEPCTACQANAFKHVTGYLPCIPCPLNSTLPSDAEHWPTSCRCDPGFTGDAGSGSGDITTWSEQALCTACPVGSYKPAFGAAACTPCGPHTATPAGASTARSECLCAELYEDSAALGGPDVPGGACVPSCVEGMTGAGGVCAMCESGKFKASRGAASCQTCPPPRRASRKGAASEDACSCPHKQMGLLPDSYVQITGIGAYSEQDLDTLTVSPGIVVPASPAFRLKRLLLASSDSCSIEVRIDGRTVFACEERDCGAVASVDLLASKGSLTVLVSQGQPSIQLERYSRREVSVDRATPWWDQAQAERLMLSQSMRVGDAFFGTKRPFSKDHCLPCPRALKCPGVS